MTREAKIGLLVGLVFLVAIGILLSDHVTNATNPTPAPIAGVINDITAAINVPGGADKLNAIVAAPPSIVPQSAVPVSAEVGQGQQLGSAHITVGLPSRQTPIEITDNGPALGNNNVAPRITEIYVPPVRGANGVSAVALDNTAGRQGPELVPAVSDAPSRLLGTPTPPVASAATVAKTVEYKAVAGDTVARMAKRSYGADTKANRDLIINANSVLKVDPRKIVIGKTYNIPMKSDSAVSHGSMAAAGSPTTAPSTGTITAAPTGPERVYVVKAGDNIWKIAHDQMRDANGGDTIRKLNRDVLKKNGDALTIGMKLRLPPVKGN